MHASGDNSDSTELEVRIAICLPWASHAFESTKAVTMLAAVVDVDYQEELD